MKDTSNEKQERNHSKGNSKPYKHEKEQDLKGPVPTHITQRKGAPPPCQELMTITMNADCCVGAEQINNCAIEKEWL